MSTPNFFSTDRSDSPILWCDNSEDMFYDDLLPDEKWYVPKDENDWDGEYESTPLDLIDFD